MKSEEQIARKLLEMALRLPAERRAAFLAEACGDDPELRRQAEALLAGSSGPDAETSTASPAGYLTPGTKLGRYVILETLGFGGMGGGVSRAR